ncbi:hypothetical protein [Exiguobacterium sp. s181]|uniref:hypothetical protein n=1 Tax=Exiguobacterium sp. s181 TaxID=2751288 RepID=UPI001BECD257|nr:hypothetical protein [Exiguobacterium sp. s181]
MEGANTMDSIIQTVQNHGERIALLEKSDEKMRDDITSINKKLDAVEKSQDQLKITLHEVSRETREVIRDGQEMTRGLFKTQETVISQLATALENKEERKYNKDKLEIEVQDKRHDRVMQTIGKWSLIIVPTIGGVTTLLGLLLK